VQQVKLRHDPAPSRLKYRFQRWMLTPGIRLGLRIGIPFTVVFVATSAWLSDEGRREAIRDYIADIRASIEERPEFMVSLLAIDGAGDTLDTEIRDVLALNLPASSFNLDIEAIRDRVAQLDPVKAVSARIRPGGILQIDVTEREPVAVWRSRNGLELVDETGAHIEDVPARTDRPELPLIAGDGADKAVPQALELFAAAKPLGERLRGLVRMGERRWDVVLDRNQRIMLPADNPVPALERVIALSEAQDMLERDVAAVDMRLAQRPTIRMSDNAVHDWWRIRQINGSGQ